MYSRLSQKAQVAKVMQEPGSWQQARPSELGEWEMGIIVDCKWLQEAGTC